MKINNKKFILTFFISVFLLLFLKTDFRLKDTITCCGDDHDYYIHAETIAIDFDLNYSNQLLGNETRRFNVDGYIAPQGFIGSGLLSAPFLLIGHGADIIFENSTSLSKKILNFRLLFYSLSSVFYYFLTIQMTIKILKYLNYKFFKPHIYLFYFGSGLAYYAFERYSMTHIYECFTVTAIIYFSLRFYINPKDKLSAFLIPLFIALGISVRWVNYFCFLLPLVTYSLVDQNKNIKNKLFNNKYFLISALLSSYLFIFHTKILYGRYTFNPQFVYGTSGKINNYLNANGNILDFISVNLINSFKILFSQEFGIFWFSPIIFVGFLISILNILSFSKRELFLNILILLTYLPILGTVLLWKSTAASYGFRYLFCLIPVSIIMFYRFQNTKEKKYLTLYLIIFSLFSTFSILFFETTVGTQLSLIDTTNSFGRSLKYTQPEYLSGYLGSLFELNSYLKIFTTSFLGSLIFKTLLLLFGQNSLILILSNFGLPVDNEDFINYLFQLSIIDYYRIAFISITMFFIARLITRDLLKA